MSVVLLLALIWAVVIVPPALRAHSARKEAFLVSFGPRTAPADSPPDEPRSARVQRRRRIAGGLVVAMVATLLVGLLPTFRVLLVVHLFLVDSFLAYIALLAHMAGRAARTRARTAKTAPEAPAIVIWDRPVRRWRAGEGGPAVLPELGTIVPLG